MSTTVKISFDNHEFSLLSSYAEKLNISVQDYIRSVLFDTPIPDQSIFTPEEAVKRALVKFTAEDKIFTLSDIYGPEWELLDCSMRGIFGRKFYEYVLPMQEIMYAGMQNRRSTYCITRKE